jgi:hypothetical protein
VLERAVAEGATWAVRDFARAMLAIHPPERLPARSAFDPVAVPKLLPHLILVSVERPPAGPAPRFLVKLLGQSMREAIKINLAGRYLDEFLAEIPTMQFPIADRERVCAHGCAIYDLRQPRTRFAFDFARIEYLHAPFADDGRTVDRILSLYAYEGEQTIPFER